jgi:uracil phosphoribosyltransferase
VNIDADNTKTTAEVHSSSYYGITVKLQAMSQRDPALLVASYNTVPLDVIMYLSNLKTIGYPDIRVLCAVSMTKGVEFLRQPFKSPTK